MFSNETSHLMFIIISLIAIEIESHVLDLHFNGNHFDFKNNLKSLKRDIDKEENIYQINRKVLEKNQYGRTQLVQNWPKSNKLEDSIGYSEEQLDKKGYQSMDYKDKSYDYEMLNIFPRKRSYSSGKIYPRNVFSNRIYARDLINSSLYPSVLTKAVAISLDPSARNIPGGSLFSNVAQKMNTTTLDLAEKIVKSETSKSDDQFSKLVQNYINSIAPPSTKSLPLNITPPQNINIKNLPISAEPVFRSDKGHIDNEYFNEMAASGLTGILDRLLNKLESIQNAKNDGKAHPEGAPCDIVGSWSSSILGFCFDIQLLKDNIRYISPAEINNKVLSISVSECTPTKHHQIIDLDWKFTGTAIKQWGGPFYIYGQKRTESVIATFLGFCRTCSGIDTIFGTWNFLSPSKDCYDISLANEVKRDIFRRVRLETKRKERFKDILYESRHEKI